MTSVYWKIIPIHKIRMCIGDNDGKLSGGHTYGLLELNPSQALPGLISLTWLVFCFEPLIVTVEPHYFCGQSRQVDFIMFSSPVCKRKDSRHAWWLENSLQAMGFLSQRASVLPERNGK